MEKPIQTIYRTLDVITVLLLLTGQINISGVFITTDGGFSLSMAGAITGGTRSVSKDKMTPNTNLVIDSVNVIAAFLLILDQINVVGTFVSAHRFTIVVSGPAFGEPKRVGYTPKAVRFFSYYRKLVLEKCNVTSTNGGGSV